MTVASFNQGWRAGSFDAKHRVHPVYVNYCEGIGVVLIVDHGTGGYTKIAPELTDYARGYAGGYVAKKESPPTGPEPVTLDTLRRQIEKLRILWLLGGGAEEDATTGLDPVAEQHYLLAIGALEQAERFATLADLHQARALGEQRSTR